MSRRGSHVPKKLKHDAIVEALLEVRFETKTSPEFLLVRLSELQQWRTFNQSRLPAYSIPETIRNVDPNFRYQPIFELLEPETSQRSVRVGANVLSYHVRAPYIGWHKFGSELRKAVSALFDKTEDLVVKRLGLRYVNALTSDLHQIRGIQDLDVSLRIGGSPVTDGININEAMRVNERIFCMVRVATAQFVAGSLPATTTVLADIDVFTPDNFETRTQEGVSDWIEEAHTVEKQEFFVLLTDETITALEER